jgi:dihydrofolate reductase
MNDATTSRTVVANISLSLDGRINGAGGEYDMSWVVPHAVSDAARDHMVRFTLPATTMLLGRKNYEGFGGYWPGVADQDDADPRDRAVSRWMNEVEKIVFSSTLTDATWAHSTIADRSPADVVADLRSRPGGDILAMSSSSIIRQLLDADLVDASRSCSAPRSPAAATACSTRPSPDRPGRSSTARPPTRARSASPTSGRADPGRPPPGP